MKTGGGEEQRICLKNEEKTFLLLNRTIPYKLLCSFLDVETHTQECLYMSLKPSIVSLIIQVLPIILLSDLNFLETGCTNFSLNTFIQIIISHYSSK